MYVLTELVYVLICQVKEKEKKCSFENALVEKSKSSTRNENELVEGLLLLSIQMFTFTDLSRSPNLFYYYFLISLVFKKICMSFGYLPTKKVSSQILN